MGYLELQRASRCSKVWQKEERKSKNPIPCAEELISLSAQTYQSTSANEIVCWNTTSATLSNLVSSVATMTPFLLYSLHRFGCSASARVVISVRSAVILCLNTVEVRHTAPSVDWMHLSPVFVSSTSRLIFTQCLSCFMSWAQIVSQPSDCSGLVSSLRPLRPCLKSQTAKAVSQVSDHVLTSNHARWLCDQLYDSPRNDVYRESSASCILVMRLVTYEISYIQPIHWWDFHFTFWHRPSSPTVRLFPDCHFSSNRSLLSWLSFLFQPCFFISRHGPFKIIW